MCAGTAALPCWLEVVLENKLLFFFFSPPTRSVYVLSLLKSDGDSRRVGLSSVSLPCHRGRAAGEARYETQGARRRGPT